MKSLKRFLLFVSAVFILTALTASAGFLGVKKSSETIVFRLQNPLDSAGIPGKPDSAHIFTYADNAASNAYAARSTTYPFSDISIDTTKNYGDTAYWFIDAIADIDGAGGNVQLGIDVVLWYKKLPTHTFATVQVISDSLNVAVDTAKQARSVWDADVVAEASRTITIPDNGITAAKIATDAIGSTELAADAITTSEFQDGVITSTKFAAGAITATAIADDAITAAKIAADAIGASEIATDAIGASEIATSAIGASEIATDAIGASEVAASAITSSEAPLLANLDATVSSRSSFSAASDSVLVDMSSFNTSLDNDTTLVNFLRAGIGGGGSSDSTSIARWVWNTPQSNHTVSGTFGSRLDATVSSRSNFNPASDSVIVDVSSALANNNLVGRIAAHTADSTLDEDTTGHYTSPNFAYTASQTAVSSFNPATDSVIVDMSGFNSALDNDTTLVGFLRAAIGGTSNWSDMQRDSVLAVIADAGKIGRIRDSVNAILDTLQVWDDDVALLAAMRDSINAILDTLQNQDNWVAKESTVGNVRDTVNAIIDTLQNQDNWIMGANDSVTVDMSNFNTTLDNDTTLISFLRLAASGGSSFDPATESVLVDMSGFNAALDNDTTLISFLRLAAVGGVASVDSASIARYVWNTPQANHVTASTFGSYLDAQVSLISGASGSGAYTLYTIVLDTSAAPDSVIKGIPVYVNNYAQNTSPYWSLTNNNGRASHNLDAGNWVRFITDARFGYELDSFTVTAAGTDTLFVYRQFLEDSDTLTTTVAWQINKPNGTFYDSAYVEIELVSVNDSMLSINNSIVISNKSRKVTIRADANGLATTHLYPNQLFTNDSTYYKVTIYNKQRTVLVDKYRCRIPVSDSAVYAQDLVRWRDD